MTEGALTVLGLAATVVLNAGFAAAVGASASAAWLHRSRSPWARGAVSSSVTVRRWALALIGLASLGLLCLRAAEMAETPLVQALPAVRSVLSESHYGRAWLIGAAGLLATLVAAGWPPPRSTTPTRSAFVMLGLVVFAWARSVTGHAGAQGDMTLAVVVDVVHLLSMGLWTGTVFVGAFVLPAGCDDVDRSDRARWVQALSWWATLALGGVVATGAFNAWHGLGSPSDLVGTGYGNALLVKLALVGVAVGLGGVNRFLWMPRLLQALRDDRVPAEPSLKRFLGILRVESLVLLAVVAAAAVLSATPPASGG